jgi:hypothetical protein
MPNFIQNTYLLCSEFLVGINLFTNFYNFNNNEEDNNILSKMEEGYYIEGMNYKLNINKLNINKLNINKLNINKKDYYNLDIIEKGY